MRVSGMVSDVLESDEDVGPRRGAWFSALVVVGLGVLNILALYEGSRPLVYLTKPTTMVAIISLAFYSRSRSRSSYSFLIIAGLICSLAGDVLLMLLSDQFVAGLAGFLVAHFFYIGAFRKGIRGLSPIVVALPVYGLGALLLWILWPGLGEMKVPVVAYLVVILTMGWQALQRWYVMRDRRSLYAVIGAGLFVASDSIIAFSRFHMRFYLANGLIMSTYFAAQWLITMSI